MLMRAFKKLDFRHFGRFAASLVLALASAALGIWQVAAENNSSFPTDMAMRLQYLLAIGISLFMIPRLVFPEDRDIKPRSLLLGGLALVYFTFAAFGRQWMSDDFFFKAAQGFLISHLAVSLAPWFRRGAIDDQVFWSENWFLLTRLQMAATQTIILCLGTLAAVFSIEKLFDLKAPSYLYAAVLMLHLFFISAMIFVSSLADHRTLIKPPEVLTRLVRTALTPLAIIYLIIIYAYAAKLAVDRQWPDGGIGFLVSGLALIVTLGYVIMRWDPLESTCRHASLSIL